MRAFLDFLVNNFGVYFESGSEVFLWFFNRAVAASWLILAAIVLRIFLKKAPKWITCALWGICALRLVLPFSLQSVLSLIPSAETVVPESIYTPSPQIDSGIPAIDNNVNEYFAQETTPIVPDNIPETIIGNESAVTEPISAFNFVSVLFVIWVIGILALLIYAVVSYIKLKKSVKGANMLEKGIFESAGVSSPFILGFFRPKIYLPLNMDNETKNYVLAHERAHLSRGDHIFKPLGFVILSLYWFSPLVWVAYILFCRDIELACDEKVVSKLERDSRADYAQALLSCATQKRAFSACPLAFGEVSIKDRVKSALHYKKPMLWVIIAAVVTTVAVAVCFLTDPIKSIQASADPEKDNTSSSVISSDNTSSNLNSIVSDAISSNTNSNTSNVVSDNSPKQETYVKPLYDFNYGNKIAFAQTQGEFSTIAEAYGSDYPGVAFSVKSIDVTSKNPQIVIEWYNYTNKNFVFGEKFSVKYKENYIWKNCKNTTSFSDRSFTVKPNTTKVHTFSLKNVVFPKDREYRFVTGNFDEFWIDFKTDEQIVSEKDLTMSYECETIDIGYGKENSTAILEMLNSTPDYNFGKTNILPTIYIKDKARLDEVTKYLGLAFDLKKQYNSTIKKYDEKFFEDKSLLMIALREESESIQHFVSGFDSGLNITVGRFVPKKCNNVKSGRLLIFCADKDTLGSRDMMLTNDTMLQVYSSDIYYNGYGNYTTYTRKKAPQKPMHVDGVNSTISSVKLDGENPAIRIYWTHYSGDRITIGKEFDIQRFENGNWVSCAGKNVKFDSDTFRLQHNALRYESSCYVTYSLKDFDISKGGTYRFIPPMSEEEYYTFKVVKKRKFNNIDFETKGINIGYGHDEGRSAFAAMRENGSSASNPLIRVDSVQKLEQVYNAMDGHFRVENMKEAFKNCDEQFFKEKTIFFVYITHGSGGYSDTVKGVEYDGKNKCTISIECIPPEVGPSIMIGSAKTIIVDKKMADSFKTFDVSIYTLDNDCVMID